MIWNSDKISSRTNLISNFMKLSIEIFSQNDNFSGTLDYIRKQLEEGFITGFDSNEDENFYYETKEELKQ